MTLIKQDLVKEICALIEKSKSSVARTINQEMTLLYWYVGKRIQEEILKFERAEYGEEIIATLSQHLLGLYGKGFSRRNLFNMLEFFKTFRDFQIVQTLSAQLTWSHLLELLSIKDDLKRNFYVHFCSLDNWSVRTLREKIGKKLFERTAISQEPQKVIKESLNLVKKEGHNQPQLFLQNPYILDFLNLPSEYNENDLETAILNEIQRFLLELGGGFCFIARQKRITVGEDDYYIDLLLYNRYLRRLVAIELKTTSFHPSYKGQMEFYLKYLDKYEKHGDDLSPIGLILCANKKSQAVELLDLEKTGIHVAEYWTELPPKEIFEQKIQEIVSQSQYIELSKPWDEDEEVDT
jgi:predicted nuclease of restriction endonuclease-like (RecB) superfamily